jgi:hypothetical protein
MYSMERKVGTECKRHEKRTLLDLTEGVGHGAADTSRSALRTTCPRWGRCRNTSGALGQQRRPVGDIPLAYRKLRAAGRKPTATIVRCCVRPHAGSSAQAARTHGVTGGGASMQARVSAQAAGSAGRARGRDSVRKEAMEAIQAAKTAILHVHRIISKMPLTRAATRRA